MFSKVEKIVVTGSIEYSFSSGLKFFILRNLSKVGYTEIFLRNTLISYTPDPFFLSRERKKKIEMETDKILLVSSNSVIEISSFYA